MVNTIEKALNPISLSAFFLGFGVLRYPLNQPRYCLNTFYILTVWSVYACVFCYTTILFSLREVFNGLLSIFTVTTNLFTAVISIIITICEHEKYWQYIRKLELVDDTLEELGIPKEYHKMRNLTRKALIIWFLITCTTCTLDSLLCIVVHNDTRAIFIPFVMTYAVYVNSITDITFILLLRHLHLELCRTARDINNFFGIQMTLQMICCFVALNGMFYFEYYTILHLKEMAKNNMALNILLSSTMWFFIFFMKLISLNHICESVSAKVQRTKNIIHKLTNLIYFADVREEIYQFVLQISLRPLKFTGWGLFYFGYDLIRKFFVWTPTTIIFMAQMNFIPVWIEMKKDDRTYYSK